MSIGLPKETKNHEYCVGLTPESAAELVRAGHEVQVQTDAGIGVGATDATYQDRGASIAPDAATVFGTAEMSK
jgi:alanine dehydrogenase